MKTLFILSLSLFAVAALAHCSSGGSSDDRDGGGPTDGAQPDVDGAGDGSSNDAGTVGDAQPIPFTCAATKSQFASNACPAPSGAAGEADFCFRPQYPGTTSVQAYYGPPSTDFSSYESVALADDGSGTWLGHATGLASGSYSYIFKVTGAADGIFTGSPWLADQRAASFHAHPPNGPNMRAIAALTVPQPPPPALHHVRGTAVAAGAPQPCYVVSLDVGETSLDGGGLAEHATANFLETGSDGKFDFEVADGQTLIAVQFPFLLSGLDAGYPSGLTTPSVGIARTTSTVSGADLDLDPADVSYPLEAYAAMSPTAGAATLPAAFAWSMVAGSVGSYMSVAKANGAGNDPVYTSPLGTMTTNTWDGTLNDKNAIQTGTPFWWGVWQHRQSSDAGTQWVDESLLFQISFQ